MTPLLLLTFAAAHAADCPTRSQQADIAAKFDAAEEAYTSLDVEVFSLSLDEAALMLPCLDAPIDPAFAARNHRMRGLRAYLERDATRAAQSFAAARALQPDYSFPTTLIPEGHSVRKQYASLDVSTPNPTTAPEPIEGWLSFDGTRGLSRPSMWPSIVQLFDAEGRLLSTSYLFPADPLPAYKAKAQPVASAAVARKPLSPKVPLLIGAGVAAVGAGVLYAMADAEGQKFAQYDERYTLTDLNDMQARTNGYVYASIGAGALAVAGGLGVVFVGHW
jgi:hypothetical protein